MSISKIEQIIKDANNESYEPLAFETGRPQAINIFHVSGNLPLLWLVTPSSTFAPIADSLRVYLNYEIELFMYYNDRQSSSEHQTILLIKSAEEYAQILAINLQNISDANNLTIQNMSIRPVYKFSANGVYSGVALTLNMLIPDDINYC